MSDAQAWTTIGSFLAILLAFMGLTIRMFTHTLDAKFAAVDARFESLTAVMTSGFAQVDRRLDRLEDRVDNLDRDVHAITRRLMDGPDQA
jgi:hypothetical protein